MSSTKKQDEALTAQEIEAKARELLDQLTLDEKLGMMDADTPLWSGFVEMLGGAYNKHPWPAGVVERLHALLRRIPQAGLVECARDVVDLGEVVVGVDHLLADVVPSRNDGAVVAVDLPEGQLGPAPGVGASPSSPKPHDRTY